MAIQPDAALAPPANDTALYPPTVHPPRDPLPLYRFLFRFLDNPLASVPDVAYEQPITVFEPTRFVKAAWVTAPELTEQILVRDAADFEKSKLEKRVFRHTIRESVLSGDGDHWRMQRRALAPMFRHGEILSYVPTMQAVANETTARWTTPGPQDIDAQMLDATFQIIARTMLDGGADEEADVLIRETGRILSAMPWEIVAELFSLPNWVPHPGSWTMTQSGKRLRSTVLAIIERRRRDGRSTSGDLLDRLLAARHPETDEPLDDELLIDNLLTLLEAGHETTARALTFTLFLLARAPDWQEAVRNEVQQLTGDAQIHAELIPQLIVTRQVIEESMRLYPPVPVLARPAIRAKNIANTVFTPHDQIIIPVYAIHRHRQLWKDPDRFDPSRFAPGRTDGMPRTQFMPFGAGPRICLGMSFAMVEATVLLATFVRAARFIWRGGEGPEPISRVTLRPKGGMSLLVEPV